MADSLPESDSPTPQPQQTLQVQQLFVRHQQALCAYVLSIEPNLADAQDIVQEVFLTLTRKAAAWTPGTDFLAWACTIARYTTLTFQRTRARRVGRLADDVVELLHEAAPADEETFRHRIAALRECFERLAPKARELVWMRYHAAQMPDEIATSVGWTVGAVRVALSRARESLRDCAERRLSRGEA